jgi:cytochrome c biogenesis protein CcdA
MDYIIIVVILKYRKNVHKMKKTTIIFSIFLLGLLLMISPAKTTKAADNTIIYFMSSTCLGCKELEDSGYKTKIEELGVNFVVYDFDVTDLSVYDLSMYNFEGTPSLSDLWTAFGRVYDVKEELITPVMFAGGDYYMGVKDIQDAFDDGSLLSSAQDELLEVDVKFQEGYSKITGFVGFLTVLGAGLLDGFNPCAIALLLLFVSLLSSNENKKVLLLVSVTYISALFISYLLIGTLLYEVLNKWQAGPEAALANTIVTWVVLIICIILFSYNMYDYIVTRNEEYGKVKNQLPKWIQRFNKSIMKRFTDVINNPTNKTGLFSMLALTFVLGVTLSITELICTGQIYGIIISSISDYSKGYAYFALVSYNFMFVLPLIAIAIFAIKGRGVMAASNWIREHLHTIKLLNAILFLFVGVYFLLRIIGVL